MGLRRNRTPAARHCPLVVWATTARIPYRAYMLLLLPLLVLPAPPRTADAVAELSKGSGLYRVCQAEVRLMDLPSLTTATQSDLLNGSYCVGYLNGYVANLQPVKAVCPGGAATGALVRNYVNFMEKNPDLLEQDRRLGLSLALRDAYPCPVETLPGTGAPSSSQTVL